VAFRSLTSQDKKRLAPLPSTPAPNSSEANSNPLTQQTRQEAARRQARLSRAFCSPHSGAWRSHSRAAEIRKTRRHPRRLPLAARCPSRPPRDASGQRGRLASGRAGAISGRKGSSRALPSSPQSLPPSRGRGRAAAPRRLGPPGSPTHARTHLPRRGPPPAPLPPSSPLAPARPVTPATPRRYPPSSAEGAGLR